MTACCLDCGSQNIGVHVDTAQLSPRQMEVLSLVWQGKTNKLIARELGITPATANRHVRDIFLKLGAHNRTEALYLAGVPRLPAS